MPASAGLSVALGASKAASSPTFTSKVFSSTSAPKVVVVSVTAVAGSSSYVMTMSSTRRWAVEVASRPMRMYPVMPTFSAFNSAHTFTPVTAEPLVKSIEANVVHSALSAEYWMRIGPLFEFEVLFDT